MYLLSKHSLIDSFNRNLMNTYCVSGIFLGSGNRKVNLEYCLLIVFLVLIFSFLLPYFLKNVKCSSTVDRLFLLGSFTLETAVLFDLAHRRRQAGRADGVLISNLGLKRTFLFLLALFTSTNTMRKTCLD